MLLLLLLAWDRDESIIEQMRELVNGALERAYLSELEAAGVGPNELTAEDAANIAELQKRQADFIANFARDVRAARDDPAAQDQIRNQRLALWESTIEAARQVALARVRAEELVVFGGHDGNESCTDCQKFKDEPHPRQWFVERNLLPGVPGSGLECGGWNCEHELVAYEGAR
ncbi:MAG: hypothetical protein WCF84_02250 [Anaerolineae bacterium]